MSQLCLYLCIYIKLKDYVYSEAFFVGMDDVGRSLCYNMFLIHMFWVNRTAWLHKFKILQNFFQKICLNRGIHSYQQRASVSAGFH